MLYLASATDVPLMKTADISIEEIEPSRSVVHNWFSLPNVRFIGSHSGCRCGFPAIQSENPIEYFDGLIAETDTREADLRSVGLLLNLTRTLVASGGEVQLYPIWDLEEKNPPKGTIEIAVASLVAERFFLHERFLHRIA